MWHETENLHLWRNPFLAGTQASRREPHRWLWPRMAHSILPGPSGKMQGQTFAFQSLVIMGSPSAPPG